MAAIIVPIGCIASCIMYYSDIVLIAQVYHVAPLKRRFE